MDNSLVVDPQSVTSPHDEIRPGPSRARRVQTRGKFLFAGDQKLYVRGVTYGPFNPEPHGSEYHEPSVVERDFERIRERGFNTVRIYTVPPRWLLDLALKHDLYLMIGLPWSQHVAFLEENAQKRHIESKVRDGVAACAGHPSVLCYAIGNEIPPSIVRWHGRGRVSRFLRRLYRIVKEEDEEEALVTYVNYPTTEYLHLPFLDFASFNVYLEERRQLEEYLAHLHHRVGDRPLLLAEVGLDSAEHGLEEQARVLNWQVDTIFTAGSAGAVVFSWTDEWYRGGREIEDWAFGLTTRDRTEKPALDAISEVLTALPAEVDESWPSISVVICTYNGAPAIEETLEHVGRLRYPQFEVLVVDDGSADATPEIVEEYPVRHVRTENRGLSSARNRGWKEARGEIVAYLDDDAFPDSDWLTYLAAAFRESDHAGIGGPNLPPEDLGPIATAIGRAPGNPKAVLTSEQEAEHIPGCNMAFYREVLERLGGFDERFRIAGDDVDFCWRVLEAGETLGYHSGAMVWHYPRSTISGFWNQQRNYGRAEAMLEEKWPSRYNALGHSRWNGRVYSDSRSEGTRLGPARIYYGQWGQALFQPLYESADGVLGSIPRLPEWYLLVGALGVLTAGGWILDGLTNLAPVFVLVVSVPVAYATAYGWAKVIRNEATWGPVQLVEFFLVIGLYALQAGARLVGRLGEGLSPWRPFADRRDGPGFVLPRTRTEAFWSENWTSAEERLEALERVLAEGKTGVRRGGSFDRWDLEVREGPFGTSRIQMAIEEHGEGTQLIRLRSQPRPSRLGTVLVIVPLLAGAVFGLAGEWVAGSVFGVLSVLSATGIMRDIGLAQGTIHTSVRSEFGDPIS